MIRLFNGLKNSLIILELLRDNEDLNNYHISIGAFTNCREVGLTYILTGITINNKYLAIPSYTWCTYEHRNSDDLIINGKDGYLDMNGELPYNGDSKYSYLAAFKYNQHYEVAEKLSLLMKDYSTLHLAKKQENVNK